MSHTPTPWSLQRNGRITRSVTGKTIAKCVLPDQDMHETQEANAAFIVEACNAYEALSRERDALKRALEIIRAEAGKPWGSDSGNTMLSEGAGHEADKALALCKEGGKG